LTCQDPPAAGQTLSITVGGHEGGCRLDALLQKRHPCLSRSRFANLVHEGCVLVDGEVKKAAYTVRRGQIVTVRIPRAEPLSLAPEPIALHVLFEDADLLVISKPAGLVVHPAPGHAHGTLVNAILHHCPRLEGIGGVQRPGIVHRLDRDTSGVMVVAKSERAHTALSEQFKKREVTKTYLALVHGEPGSGSGKVTLPVGRHPLHRKKMLADAPGGRCAETLWKVKERFKGATFLELELKTGRTHQIRVHCAAMGHSVMGDPVYGARRPHRELPLSLQGQVASLARQMLHAWRLAFLHPRSGSTLDFTAPLPADMTALLHELREKAAITPSL